MPDRAVPSFRRAAPALLAALAVCTAACSSGGSDEAWRAEKAYGTEMARQGFWREALFRYEKAAALKPGDAEIQNNLAVSYESIGDTARALAAYKRALELAPQDTKIKRNYARFAEYYTSVQRAAALPAPSSSAPPEPTPTPAATPAPSPTPAAAPTPPPSGLPSPRAGSAS